MLPGKVPETIVRYADFIHADLLLLTSRTRGAWNGFWKRSVATQLMKLSRGPVCVTTAAEIDSDFRFRSRRLLCVVGLDGQDLPLVQYAQEIARRADAELVLLHVVPEVSEGLLYYAAGAGSRPLSKRRAAEDLLQLAACVSVPVTTLVMVGGSSNCIVSAAREYAADMVIAARPRAGTRFASTEDFEGALSQLRCPLLTVPVDDGGPSRHIEDEVRRGWRSITAGGPSTGHGSLPSRSEGGQMTVQNAANSFHKIVEPRRFAFSALTRQRREHFGSNGSR
jgi:nucleotide-binding universal stress UspA family protein